MRMMKPQRYVVLAAIFMLVAMNLNQNAGGIVSLQRFVQDRPICAVDGSISSQSRKWLANVRVGNSDVNMTDDFVRSMLLDYLVLPTHKPAAPPVILQQSLCHEASRFMTWEQEESTDDIVLQRWVLRLLFLIIHDHQHRPAFKEAKERLACGTKVQSHVGKYDFECPDAKFLVLSLGGIGLGASIHLLVVHAFLVGILTDRVVLFVNGYSNFSNETNRDVPWFSDMLEKGWGYASCNRGDFQCFFLPPSPCVLTTIEIDSAPTIMNATQYVQLHSGLLPPELENARVLLLPFMMNYEHPHNKPPESAIIEKIAALGHNLVRRMQSQNRQSSSLRMLENAAKALSFIQSQRALNAFVFYFLRPSLMYQKRIQSELERIFPPDFDPDFAIGLPIRATDKCGGESECLSFDNYVEIARIIGEERRWGVWNDTSLRPPLYCSHQRVG